MMSDEEVQKYARKSAILIAKMKDGTYKVFFLMLDQGLLKIIWREFFSLFLAIGGGGSNPVRGALS